MGRAILEDTRQQRGKHELKHEWWETNGYALVRSKLPFGDYCTLPAVAVDTKASIAELAADIDQQHDRFRRELKGARDAGVRLVVLVENGYGVRDLGGLAAWDEPAADFARRVRAVRPIRGARLARACATMAERYGAEFLFCAPDEAAGVIAGILFEGAGDGRAR